jgi:hypothetical protein
MLCVSVSECQELGWGGGILFQVLIFIIVVVVVLLLLLRSPLFISPKVHIYLVGHE